MIKLGRYDQCKVKNPVVRDKDGNLVFDKFGQVKVNLGDTEYRVGNDKLYSEPFPLYPSEELVLIQNVETIPRDCYGKIVAEREFTDVDGKKRFAGDEWLIEGPKTYIPRIEVKLDAFIRPIIILKNHALRLRARRACVDSQGVERKDKEEWLIRTPGPYVPRIDEEVVDCDASLTTAISITET